MTDRLRTTEADPVDLEASARRLTNKIEAGHSADVGDPLAGEAADSGAADSGAADYRALVAQLREARHRGSDEGRPEAVARQHGRGKFTARERVALLADPGTFREFGGLVGAARP